MKASKMNKSYSIKFWSDDLTMKELQPFADMGDKVFLMFKAIGSDQVAKDSQVWIKESNSYCREDKKYIVTNCADFNKTKLVDGSKKIFTSFTY